MKIWQIVGAALLLCAALASTATTMAQISPLTSPVEPTRVPDAVCPHLVEPTRIGSEPFEPTGLARCMQECDGLMIQTHCADCACVACFYACFERYWNPPPNFVPAAEIIAPIVDVQMQLAQMPRPWPVGEPHANGCIEMSDGSFICPEELICSEH